VMPRLGGPTLGIGPVGPDVMFGPGEVAGTDPLDKAADYLGMDEADVRTALRDGRSLADLARDKGKSVDGLKRALRDAIREDADKAVEDGALTREQADRFVEEFGSAVDKLVDDNLTRGFDFGFRSGDGNFKFDFRIAPDSAVPRPDDEGSSSSDPPRVPLQPAWI
jgi:hypothetical protein